MDKLKVDTQQFRETASELSLIKDEFDHADDNSDALADAVGDGDLAGRVRDFAHNWDIHRKKMMGDIETLIKSLNEGADGLEETDRKLGDTLTNGNKGGSAK